MESERARRERAQRVAETRRRNALREALRLAREASEAAAAYIARVEEEQMRAWQDSERRSEWVRAWRPGGAAASAAASIL